ncbi:hypothetical protein SCBWM1_gp128 [Synechococcus phage S-CBWM1]|uniref:Uncharacterized protein n=1 Tax=Synechococcus phage S-CBWM1 TaxID=2053653 RepID=A0A3G1L3P8_9CAUD|nr:hypothetical protein HOU61_gp069 [Synechococcus phage S-CBWM1]ATW62812.1 hypothetical protein SCBWM1_gp128 [Synechococcus phage S-CBWM1]
MGKGRKKLKERVEYLSQELQDLSRRLGRLETVSPDFPPQEEKPQFEELIWNFLK